MPISGVTMTPMNTQWIWRYRVGPPFNSVQLVYKWLNEPWFMVDITIVFMGIISWFINQRSHHWGAPSCTAFSDLSGWWTVESCELQHQNIPPRLFVDKESFEAEGNSREEGYWTDWSCRVSDKWWLYSNNIGINIYIYMYYVYILYK